MMKQVEMEVNKRKIGIEVLEDAPWGTHFCLFYKNKGDLIDILVPYFKKGLENNEFCLLITSDPFKKIEAVSSFKNSIPNFNQYAEKGQIEILSYSEWYGEDGKFNLRRVLNGWIKKLNQALNNGYDGLRISGNTTWLEQKYWKNFAEYEEEINNIIGDYKMIAICTYSLDKCGPMEIIDVVRNHQFALIRHEGIWEILKNSQQIKLEQKFRESEEKFRIIADQSLMGLCLLQEGVVKYCNQCLSDIYGYSIEEMKNWDPGEFAKLIHPEDKDMVLEQALKKQMGLKDVTYRYQFRAIKRTGETIWIENLSKTILYMGKPADLIAIIDITENKRIGKKIKESERKYKNLNAELETILDLIPGMIFCKDKNDVVTRVNQNFANSLKLSKEDIVGKTTFDLFPKDLAKKYREDDLEVINSGKPKLNIVEIADFPDGKMWFITSKVPHFDKNGEIVGILGLATDITERKHMAEKLRESENKYRILFEEAADSILTIDADTGGIVDFNAAAYKNLGYSYEEFKQMKLSDIDAIKTPEEIKKHVEKINEEGADNFETKLKTKDGKVIDVHINVKPIIIREKPFFISIYRDITERKHMEEKLRESKEKFQDAYTRMIFYQNLIAHDINNVFNNIQSLIYLFHHYQNKPEKIKKLNDIINEIKEQGVRGEILIKNIRKLSLMEDTQISLKRIEILDVLEESIKYLHKSFKNKKINVQVDSISNELFAQANDLLFDVYDNILNNAVKYNNNPSVEIIIRIKKEEKEKKKYIKMEFIDNGIGIPDVRKPFIFEKNINMKDYTKGMGIGLSLVYKIIESYHGYIRVEDKINGDYSKGSKFNILIPKAL